MGYRYRYGDTKPVSLAIKTAIDFALGDCVFIDTSALVTVAGDATTSYSVAPASDLTYQSDITTVTGATTPTTALLEAGASGSGFSSSDSLTYKLSVNYPWGEGTLSAASSGLSITSSGDAARVLLVDTVAPGLSMNVYTPTANGSSTYKLNGTFYGASDVYLTAWGKGRTPPTAAPQTALAFTQYNFGLVFAGVAAQGYDGTSFASGATPRAYGITDGKVRVDTSGVYEFDCAAAAVLREGDLVGLSANGGGTALLTTTVEGVAHASLAIGRVARANNKTAKVWVEIMARRFTGGMSVPVV